MAEFFDAVLAEGREIVALRLKCRGENIADRKLEAMLARLQSAHEAVVAERKARAGRAVGLLQRWAAIRYYADLTLLYETDAFLSEQAGERENENVR